MVIQNMKVWVVEEEYGYLEFKVAKIFSSRESALNWIKKQPFPTDFSTEEMEVEQ